jgi:hypothetical protein
MRYPESTKMFTWICPKCGKEVPPAYSECPNCAATQQAAAEPAAPAGPQTAAPPPAPARHRSTAVAVPWWFLIALLAIAFVGVGIGVVSWQQQRHARAATPAAAPLEAPPAGPAVQANPIFRDIELTGLRLTEDAKQKASVQFVLVNHSAADLGEVAGTVHLKAVAKRDQDPVGTFSFKASLGPYESKDMKEPLDTKLRVYELPDWQFLRADITAK